MDTINLEQMLELKFPKFLRSKSKFTQKMILLLLKRVLYLDRVNELIELNREKPVNEIIEFLFEYLNFKYTVAHSDLKKIPSEGRLIVAANHPIGSLDGLALYRIISEVRSDVKVVTTDVLEYLPLFKDIFLSVNIESIAQHKSGIRVIGETLMKDEAIIIFPAGEVSRMRLFKIMDSRWNKGAVYFSRKYNAPILPIHINARNSFLFYLISSMNKGLSRAMLVHELFNKRNDTINLSIGDYISAKSLGKGIKDKVLIKLLKKHIYNLSANKSKFFQTEKNVIHPINKKLIYKELSKAKVLGETNDNKQILLTSYLDSPNTLEEIGRLREITFRLVGEGTGNKRDNDEFDKHYEHIILWDMEELEIVGAYRVFNGKNPVQNKELKLYSSTLFNYSEMFEKEYLKDSLELGRSFIQKKYWNTNALHYLWLGIGAYLSHNKDVKYLFGPVSISDNYSQEGKEWIVHYCNKWFSGDQKLAEAKNPFQFSIERLNSLDSIISGSTAKQDYLIVKSLLKHIGFTFPVLYKHYTELCSDGGVKFFNFNIDNSFGACVDGLIFVELSKIKEDKRNKYLSRFQLSEIPEAIYPIL
ncbi:MAG: lysophospholipid acyltransferase family protein [Bacteroidota bacterium]